jgi:hypothetical protein
MSSREGRRHSPRTVDPRAELDHRFLLALREKRLFPESLVKQLIGKADVRPPTSCDAVYQRVLNEMPVYHVL